jgi:HSP20 family protein
MLPRCVYSILGLRPGRIIAAHVVIPAVLSGDGRTHGLPRRQGMTRSDTMSTLSEQVRQGAEHAWASLAEGWRELRTRASGALTRFRRDDRAATGGASFERFGSADWGLMAADIRVDDDRVVVRLEAPGMSREDLHIDIDHDRLCVWGDKRFDSETREGDYHLVQCAYGSFRRDLVLPQPVDAAQATARYRDGVLRIEIPRLERGQAQRIVVHGD